MPNPLCLTVETTVAHQAVYTHPTGLRITITPDQVKVEAPDQPTITLQQPPTETLTVGRVTYLGPKNPSGEATYELVEYAAGYPRQITRTASGGWTCSWFDDGRQYPTPETLIKAVVRQPVTLTDLIRTTILW